MNPKVALSWVMEIERTERRRKGSVTLVGFSQKAPLAPWFVSDSSRGGGFARLVNRREVAVIGG